VARIERYEEMGPPHDVALTLTTDPPVAGYFENVVETAGGTEPRVLANWVTGEPLAALRRTEVEGGAADSRVREGQDLSGTGIFENSTVLAQNLHRCLNDPASGRELEAQREAA
jgi:hypothetical protein